MNRWTLPTASTALLDAALEEWSEAIADLSNDEIRDGLKLMRDTYPDWPPTTGQFRALCRPPKAREPEYRYPPLYIPPPPEDEEVKRARLAKSAANLREVMRVLKGGKP